MRALIATCTVDYSGRLSVHLDLAKRAITIKSDGSVLIHSDRGSYKPLDWMNAPCTVTTQLLEEGEEIDGVAEVWTVQAAKTDDRLVIRIFDAVADVAEGLGVGPGLVKDGVETHLQEFLAEQVPQILGDGWGLVRREFSAPVGSVDLMVTDPSGANIAIEVKCRGGIDEVDQLTRYLSLLDRNPFIKDLRGIFAAQEISKQARILAEDRGIRCLILGYSVMRDFDDPKSRLS